VSFNYQWAQWENNAMAEGGAEYYAEKVYMHTNQANLQWPAPYDGEKQWAQRIRDGEALLVAGNDQNTDKANLHLGDGNGRTIQQLEQYKWRLTQWSRWPIPTSRPFGDPRPRTPI